MVKINNVIKKCVWRMSEEIKIKKIYFIFKKIIRRFNKYFTNKKE